jgi:hypothetical protein
MFKANLLRRLRDVPSDRIMVRQLQHVLMLFTAQVVIKIHGPNKARSIRYFAN